MAEGGKRSLWGIFHKETSVIPHSGTNHLPKTPPPNAIILMVRISTYGFWGSIFIKGSENTQLANISFLGLLQRDCVIGQCQMLPVTSPGQPFETTKLFIVCSCLCLDLVCMQRTKLCTKAGFYQPWSWGQISQRPKVSWDLPPSASVCWLPVILSHWKSSWQYTSCMR